MIEENKKYIYLYIYRTRWIPNKNNCKCSFIPNLLNSKRLSYTERLKPKSVIFKRGTKSY